MIKLKVKVTKEILRKSMNCGIDSNKKVSENCAVAYAVREVFPEASIDTPYYYPFNDHIVANHNGSNFIIDFDLLRRHPEKRLDLPETEVELEITEEILDELIRRTPDYEEVVSNSEILELV